MMFLPACVLLNGTSSSGKTIIAKVLQELLPDVFLNFSIDNVLYALPPSDLANMIAGTPVLRCGYSYKKLVDGFHGSLRALLANDNRLIVDNAISSTWMREGFSSAVEGFATFKVGVYCDLDEARRRELNRGDRAVGTVDRDMPLVHLGMDYDLRIDTTTASPTDAAQEIMRVLSTGR